MLNDFTAEASAAKKKTDWKKIFKEYIIPYGLEIIIIVLFVKFVAFFTIVPTESMYPTIAKGSCIISTRLYEPEKNVKRGDILVFKNDELGKTLIKRCIGLPGDYVSVETDGTLNINGEIYPEDYAVEYYGYSGTFIVSEGCYLFFGDNRPYSGDARVWDEPYIAEDKLLGKAIFTLWPLNNFGTLN